jgi:hypothetical protein
VITVAGWTTAIFPQLSIGPMAGCCFTNETTCLISCFFSKHAQDLSSVFTTV